MVTSEVEKKAAGGGGLAGVDVTADHNGEMLLTVSGGNSVSHLEC